MSRRLAGGWLLAGLLACAAARGDVLLDLSYVDLGSPQYQRFEDWVTGALAGPPYPYGFSATDAIYVYRLAASGGAAAYATEAIAIVDAQVAAAETEIAAGRRPEIAYDSYLHVGPMLRDLALTLDWAGALIDTHPGFPNRRARWSAYASQAVWNVWHPEDATWGGIAFPWSGWSIDNPGNNYHYSFLEATMCWALAADDAALVTFLETDKLPDLIAYYAALPGGGSREGTGYGTAHMNLFSIYRLWGDSRPSWSWSGALGHLLGTIDYWVHATVPQRDRFAPIGDQSRESYPALYDYHRRLVLEARAMAGADPAAARASWWLERISVDEMTSGFNYRHDLLPAGTSATPPAATWHHATGVGHLFARTGWGVHAIWLAMVAGPYDESHAHQDQGSFTLFSEDFLAVTENVFTHSGIQQGTEVHNVVRFEQPGGAIVPQRNSVSTMNVTPATGGLTIAADLSPAFHPAGDGVDSWTRQLDFGYDGVVLVSDQFALAPGVAAIWQLNTPTQPVIAGGVARSGGLRIRPLLPIGAAMTAVEWSTIDPAEFLAGWKLEIRGGATQYVVELVVEDDAIFADGFESGSTSAWSAVGP